MNKSVAITMDGNGASCKLALRRISGELVAAVSVTDSGKVRSWSCKLPASSEAGLAEILQVSEEPLSVDEMIFLAREMAGRSSRKSKSPTVNKEDLRRCIADCSRALGLYERALEAKAGEGK